MGRIPEPDAGDITAWLEWYVGCLGRAVEDSQETLSGILNKSVFWREFSNEDISDRQRKMLNIYLDGKEAKITAKNWSRLGAVSLDTAIRDIRELEHMGILSPLPGRIRKIEYAINYVKTDMFLKRFCDIHVEDGEKKHYLAASFDGAAVRERISELDYEQYISGAVNTTYLVHKYMAYLSAIPDNCQAVLSAPDCLLRSC